MTREETNKIIFVIRAAYPESFARLGRNDLDLLATTWQKLLSEYTYAQVSAGLEIYLVTDKYGRAPKVGQIIDAIKRTEESLQHIHKAALNANEAWAMVYKAICNSNYNADAEFDRLPPLVQKAVGSANNLRDYAAMNVEDVQVTVKAHFKSVYEAEERRAQDIARMPQRIREAIEAGDGLLKIGGET